MIIIPQFKSIINFSSVTKRYISCNQVSCINRENRLTLKKIRDLFVVETAKDLHKDKKGIVLEFTGEGRKIFKTRKDTGYCYWFDIVTKKQSTKSLASFSFNLTKSGKEKFAKFGIPDVFPAITVNKANTYTSYYFSGDFADKKDFLVFYQAAGLYRINSLLIPNYGSDDSFFWKVYAPVMEKIFDDAYNNKVKQVVQASK